MDAAFFILRDHPVNEERQQESLKPANCLWLWGQGRAALWPPLPERYGATGVVIASSDVHRGVGLCAGLEAVEIPVDAENDSKEFAGPIEAAVRELTKKDLVYLHTGLSDDVLHATDVQEKVRAIEKFDTQVVGPILTALATHSSYRLLVVCDPGLASNHGRKVPPILYALCDSGGQSQSGAAKRFHEQEEHIAGTAPRDATKLMTRLFPRGA